MRKLWTKIFVRPSAIPEKQVDVMVQAINKLVEETQDERMREVLKRIHHCSPDDRDAKGRPYGRFGDPDPRYVMHP